MRRPSPARSARRGRRRRGRAPPARTGPRRRSPGRTGRAAAWPGCTAGRGPGRTGRWPGSRRPGRARRRARTRARPRRRVRQRDPGLRAVGVEQAQQHPVGDARRPRRSWCRPSRRGRARAGTGAAAGSAGAPSRLRRASRRRARGDVADGRAPSPCRRADEVGDDRRSSPVWCVAPRPAPLSPWKYSLNTRLSFHAGSLLQPLDPAEARPAPVRRRRGRSTPAGRRRSSATSSQRSARCPDPVGYSTVKSSPKKRW